MAGFTPYLTVQIMFGAALGVVLLMLTRMLVARSATSAYPGAVATFGAWWGSLGLAWFSWVLDSLVVHSGATGAAAGVADWALVLLWMSFLVLAFGCLCAYFAFLFVGSGRLSVFVWAIYGGLALLFAVVFTLANPPASHPVTGLYGPLFGSYTSWIQPLRAVIYLPLAAGAIAMLFAARRAADPAQRRRVLLVAVSLVLYLVIPIVSSSNPGIEPATTGAWLSEIVNKLGLIVAIWAAIVAYRARPGSAPRPEAP